MRPNSSNASPPTATNSPRSPEPVPRAGWAKRQSAKCAAVEDDRRYVVHGDLVDPQDDDGVVTGRHQLVDRALQPHAGAVHEHSTAGMRVRLQPGEPVAGLGCQGPGSNIVRFAEQADTQGRQVLELGPRLGIVLHTERDQRRIQRHRNEGAGGQADPDTVDFRGDRNDTGREMAERLTQRGGGAQLCVAHNASIFPRSDRMRPQ